MKSTTSCDLMAIVWRMKPSVHLPFTSGKASSSASLPRSPSLWVFLQSEVLQRVTFLHVQELYLHLEVCKISLGPFSQCIHILPKSHFSLQSTDCSPNLIPSTNLLTAYFIPLARSLMQDLNSICPSIDPEEKLVARLTESLAVGPASLSYAG